MKTYDNYEQAAFDLKKMDLINRAKQLHQEILSDERLRDYVISFDDKDLAYKEEDK